ncbi:MAG TPA: nucleoside hydrolase [Bryobacteraceae bacterium]|nr:nucleoside hydrolase [Bryobacteraceae bacterium]
MRNFLLVLLLAGTMCRAQERTPIIFDTDIGDDIDDALALALALQSPELDVRAVTTVIDDTETRTRLAWKELGLYGRHDIPLATGASEPLLDPVRRQRAPQFRVLTDADTIPAAAHRRAADLIIDTLMASDRPMTLVPVGPLTNIALALKSEPRIKEKIARIVLMGGAFHMLYQEYNIWRDRVAAEIVFASGVPITAVGLDVTTRCKLEGADLARLRAASNPASQFLAKLIELWQDGHPNQFPTLHDPLAVASAARPHLIETQLGSVEVETGCCVTNGMTMFKPADQLAKDQKASTEIATDVNVRGFLNLFLDRVTAAPRGR